jgi:hypothetical protein
MKKEKIIHNFVIWTKVLLYILVSVISTIHSIDFFKMTNPEWLAYSLAIAFEFGAAASLAAIIVLKKINKSLVWGLFILLTVMQVNANMHYAYTHAQDYISWIELWGLVEEDIIFQKRLLAIISGGILPIVALGFIKSLVDYVRPEQEDLIIVKQENTVLEETPEIVKQETVEEIIKEDKPSEEDIAVYAQM